MLLRVTGGTSTQLELRIGSRRWLLAAGEELVIGRGTDVGVPVADDRVSRRHAVVRHEPEGWVWEDSSRNGSWRAGGRVSRLRIDAPTRLLLGDRDAGVAVELVPLPAGGVGEPPGPAGPGLAATAVHALAGSVVTIGREPGNSIVVSDLLVSRRHAEFRRSGGAWQVRDLASHNGTFVNGQRVTSAVVGPLDLVGIGHQLFRVVGDRVEEYTDSGDIAFQARDLVVTVGRGKRLLDGVGFALAPRSLLAVVGPSGAGKSTLLAALTGSRPADSGQVGYAGRDLYSNYEDLRDRIGLVPQQDILHTQLGVRRALLFAAKLRFPADVGDADRARRVDEVIAELGLAGQRDQTIASLSGGQRKRVSVALELLTKPSLLFLDEPTSGLDPGLDKAVMALLRNLADDGRTVVVVTHSVAHLDGCDRLLVLAPGGRVAYFGPPGEALEFFGAREFADVFASLDRGDLRWDERFRASPLFERYLASQLRPVQSGAGPASRGAATGRQPPIAQFRTLCRRYLAVIAADRQYSAFLAGLPVVLSLFAHAVPGRGGLSVSVSRSQAQQLLLVVIVGGSLMGTAVAVRELVKERAIYLRERAIGLSPLAYLGSKLAVLSGVVTVQAAVLTVLALLGRPGPDAAVLFGSGRLEVGLAVVGVTVASMVLGLVISALVDNADRTMPLLVFVIMAQLVFTGALFPVQGRPILEQLSWLAPARWAFAAAAATVGLRTPVGPDADPLWQHSAGTWIGDMVVLAVVAGLLAVLAARLLLRWEPSRRRARPATRRWPAAAARPG